MQHKPGLPCVPESLLQLGGARYPARFRFRCETRPGICLAPQGSAIDAMQQVYIVSFGVELALS